MLNKHDDDGDDEDIALLNKSSHSYGMSLAIWDHTVLPST